VSFRQVNKQTGNRLRQQLVDSVTEVVEAEDKGRGYEVGENQFLVVAEEELEKAREEARTRPFSGAPAAEEDAPCIARRGAPKVEAKRSTPEPDIVAPPRSPNREPSQKTVIELMAMLKQSLRFERSASETRLKPRRAAAAVSRTGTPSARNAFKNRRKSSSRRETADINAPDEGD
jgi:non-homologous end joining protein Ku